MGRHGLCHPLPDVVHRDAHGLLHHELAVPRAGLRLGDGALGAGPAVGHHHVHLPLLPLPGGRARRAAAPRDDAGHHGGRLAGARGAPVPGPRGLRAAKVAPRARCALPPCRHLHSTVRRHAFRPPDGVHRRHIHPVHGRGLQPLLQPGLHHDDLAAVVGREEDGGPAQPCLALGDRGRLIYCTIDELGLGGHAHLPVLPRHR
mmetsp:Transcript_17033/g.48676  ORF Transcript_17033/g.48676 Transcript_17033/m.48676 type:complete len:203 (+) Transcript_17033:526-1134(+)